MLLVRKIKRDLMVKYLDGQMARNRIAVGFHVSAAKITPYYMDKKKGIESFSPLYYAILVTLPPIFPLLASLPPETENIHHIPPFSFING